MSDHDLSFGAVELEGSGSARQTATLEHGISDPASCGSPEIWVNDIHSQLNATRVGSLVCPSTEEDVRKAVVRAGRGGDVIAVCGCRHAMGGQQFASGEMLLDMRQLNRVLSLDRQRGLVEVEAGVQWGDLVTACLAAQKDDPAPWTIAQKQTGADNFTVGGSLSANIHGRGLTMKPFIADVESFTLVNAQGESVRCSRTENPELFSLVIGGYGLFGIITRVTLRLVRRTRLERQVAVLRTPEVMSAFEARIAEGCTYGDFQFSIDERSGDFLQLGIFSCYRPAAPVASEESPRELSTEEWLRLLHLAYTDRAEAFRSYSQHYRSTHGQIYWSDSHQLGPYLPDYAARMRELTGDEQNSTLVITEVYVPRTLLATFLSEAAGILRANRTVLIYGTVRLIERDDESFLAWADKPYACIVFNLLTPHSKEGRERTSASFRELIDLALAHGGSFYLTYHRYAERRQITACYPQFNKFLALKRKYDPEERFQSDWYRHYREFEEE
ncbi:MAG: FAD-binding oxidoreductase [Verrucomicrobiaceae bacterium]|nr:MAG: FAD-binding oxidoreductase [Verrucomicrobiaceae bacterium]